MSFAESLEQACIDVADKDGVMTKDLALAVNAKVDESGQGERVKWVTTGMYLDAVERRMRGLLREKL